MSVISVSLKLLFCKRIILLDSMVEIHLLVAFLPVYATRFTLSLVVRNTKRMCKMIYNSLPNKQLVCIYVPP